MNKLLFLIISVIFYSTSVFATDVSGKVYEDVDNNCILAADENATPGVIVTLCDSNRDPIASTVTDADGNYSFTDFSPGDYIIKVESFFPCNEKKITISDSAEEQIIDFPDNCCEPPCAELVDIEIECDSIPGLYKMYFSVQNNDSTKAISKLSLQSPMPSTVFFRQPGSGADLMSATVPINVPPSSTNGIYCIYLNSIVPITTTTNMYFKIGVYNLEDMQDCCYVQDSICVPLPPCCMETSNFEIVCIPDSNKYRLTFDVTNYSNIASDVTKLQILVKNTSSPPITLPPTGGFIDWTNNPLPKDSTRTISTCVDPFPITDPNLILGYILHHSVDQPFDTCCFDIPCDTIPIPECDSACSGDLIDLELTKSADVEVFDVGDFITFTIEICNNSPCLATGVEVEDNLPPEVGYISQIASAGVYSAFSGIWTIGDIEPFTCHILQIVVEVFEETEKIINTAQVISHEQTDIDSEPDNDDGDQSEDDEDIACVFCGTCIDGVVFDDKNGDGVQDPNEQGIPNVIVTITFPDGTTKTTTTDDNGEYECCPLLPGTYNVSVGAGPNGSTLTTAGSNTVNLGECESIEVDFGFQLAFDDIPSDDDLVYVQLPATVTATPTCECDGQITVDILEELVNGSNQWFVELSDDSGELIEQNATLFPPINFEQLCAGNYFLRVTGIAGDVEGSVLGFEIPLSSCGPYGCTDPTACNYDSEAATDDGTCEFGDLGCLDPCNCPPTPRTLCDPYNRYPWLSDILPKEKCFNTEINVYSLGAYSFVEIIQGELEKLYLDDGTYYCTNESGISCKSFYGLLPERLTCSYICPNNGLPSENFEIISERLGSSISSDFEIFPNPSNGQFKLLLPYFGESNSFIKIYNTQGQLITEINTMDEIAENNFSVNLQDLSNGIYFIEVSNGYKSKVKRLVIQ